MRSRVSEVCESCLTELECTIKMDVKGREDIGRDFFAAINFVIPYDIITL